MKTIEQNAVPTELEAGQDCVDETISQSFPASDPPSFTPLHAGAPAPPEPIEDGTTGLGHRLRDAALALSPTLEERQAFAHAGSESGSSRILERIGERLRAIGCGAIVRRPLRDGDATLESIELDLAGTTRAQEIVVVGVHYDASHAHDNVSGMASLLELARRATHRKALRSLRFVFFPRGEVSRVDRRRLGSAIYAAQARARGEQITAMIALECLGCQAPTLPAKEDLPFPTAGLMFVANLRSRALADGAARVFREATRVHVDTIALPGVLPILRSMDHWAFWEAGYRAFAVTDTWPLRDRRFCTPAHSPERLDFHRMEGATFGLDAVVASLSRAG